MCLPPHQAYPQVLRGCAPAIVEVLDHNPVVVEVDLPTMTSARMGLCQTACMPEARHDRYQALLV